MAEQNQITCPHCGQTYAVRPEQWPQYQGQTIHCTRCGRPFTVGAGQPAQSAPAAPMPPSPGTMPQAYPPAGPVNYAGPRTGYTGEFPLPGEEPRTSGMAVASLILGILAFCVPLFISIPAIITGILGIKRTSRPNVSGRGMAIAGLSLGCVSLVLVLPLMISILLPALNRAREQANRVKCASNMRIIGQALVMYANADRQQRYPDSLDDLVKSGMISYSTLVCPSTQDTPATASANLNTGGHLSYVYLGKGLTSAATSDTVLLYEPLSNHRNEGINVLYGDGHIDFLPRNQAQQVITQVEHGFNPPNSVPPIVSPPPGP